jgi:hypothetical protein
VTHQMVTRPPRRELGRRRPVKLRSP